MMSWFIDKVRDFMRNEEGADAVEYLLTIAVIAVAVVGGVASGLAPAWLGAIITGVCTAITAAFPTMALAC